MKKKIGNANKVPNLVITPLKGVSLEDLLEYEPILNLVRQETPKGIERAITGFKQDATLLEINNSGYCIEIPQKFWKNALDACLEHYSTLEDFEKCIEIQKTLQKLEEYNKIPTTQKPVPKKNRHGRK